MAQTLRYSRRIFAAAALLCAGLSMLALAARSGEVRIGAKQVEIILADEEDSGLALHITARKCQPDCGPIGIDWRRRADSPQNTSFEARQTNAPARVIAHLAGELKS